MKRISMVVLLGAWLVLCGGFAFAAGPENVDQGGPAVGGQAPGEGNMSFDTYVELMRTDLRAKKKAIVSKAMGLTAEQEKVFWPIYNDYEHDMGKFTDVGIAIVKEYSQNFQNMTDEKARDLMNRTLDNQAGKVKLRKAYGRKIDKALNAKIAARFLQVDGTVNKMVELQIDSKLPIIK